MTTTYVTKVDGYPHIDKDDDAKLSYGWDWADWITSAGSAGIASVTITAESGVTLIGSASINSNIVSQVISGGTAGQSYKVRCKITTSDAVPLIDERTIVIDVKQR